LPSYLTESMILLPAVTAKRRRFCSSSRKK
jgi:hypothetical protein